jgi:hypothetical protein
VAEVLARYVARLLEQAGLLRDTGLGRDRALLDRLREGGFL